jgi:hypothetical protein
LVILASEATWIWLPTVAGFFIVRGLQYVWSGLWAKKAASEE